jgi:hypothetical protein
MGVFIAQAVRRLAAIWRHCHFSNPHPKAVVRTVKALSVDSARDFRDHGDVAVIGVN